MTRNELNAGLMAIGAKITSKITIVISGSGALVLGEHISREPDDCDVGDVSPSAEADNIVSTGNEGAEELGYTENWFNTSCMAWQEEFPTGWQLRTVEYKTFDNLTVRLMSRPDCVSMLVLRMMNGEPERDLIDVNEMGLTGTERTLILAHTNHLSDLGYDMSRPQIAFGLL